MRARVALLNTLESGLEYFASEGGPGEELHDRIVDLVSAEAEALDDALEAGVPIAELWVAALGLRRGAER